MFYSQFIVAKKGPLGTIWIAAHLERKLRKNQVADTDIPVSVDSILFPEVPIALRLSSHLLLGVVRIYSRKVNYLFDDCSEALLKIKQAFRSTAVDLPPEESTAPYHSITLPETFDLDDFELPESDILQGNYVDHHVSTREQITLQDTMEGVVYSTTQFGLDERFGDGETSGLNLDEEIFLNKVTAPGPALVIPDSDAEPHASVQPMSPLEQDKSYEGINGNSDVMLATGRVNQLDGLPRNTDYIEYAQAPCTPGLVEEPSLSKTQEASACDDLLELVEEPNLPNFQEASAFDDHLEPEDHNLTNIAARDNTTFESVNGLQELQNGINSNGEPDIRSIDGPHADGVELQVVGSSFSHEVNGVEGTLGNFSSASENNGEKSCVSSTCQPVSEYVSEINQAPVRPEVSNNAVNEGNMEKSCPTSNSVASNIESSGRQDLEVPEKTVACQDLVVDEKVADADVHVLQPCKHLNQFSRLNSGCDVSVGPQLPSGVTELGSTETSGRNEEPHVPGASTEIQGEGCHADFMKHVLEENQTMEPASYVEIQEDTNKFNDQLDDVILTDTRMENIVGSENFELPAPEKLLSVREGLADLQNNLLESTPDESQLVSGDGGDGGINSISGKKRSFTESSLTVQSLNSVESLAGAGSKRIKESVPDDDDLLASILVGRRSSVLKIMPTPTPPTELTSMKRQRSVARSGASKRKVLMDDAMILHGDVIRQQLTSTEDIRRIRKKAPCTRGEIWMIQKEFLEDEIFSEPVFTDFSRGLALLHSQKFDLSEIRVSHDDAHNDLHRALLEDGTNPLETANMDFSLDPEVDKDTGMERINESLVGRNHVEAEHPENPKAEDRILRSEGYDTQVQMEALCDIPEPHSLPHEQLAELAQIDLDGAVFSVPDAVNPAIDVGVESASSPIFVLGDEINISAMDASDRNVQIDASGLSPGQKLDVQSVEMETSIAYIISEKGIDTIKKSEENDYSDAVGGTESRVRDELLEETEVGASVETSVVDKQAACNEPTWEANASLEIYPETDKPTNQDVVAIDHAMEEVNKNEQGFLNEDDFLAPELGYDGKMVSSIDGEFEADQQRTTNADFSGIDHTATVDDSEYAMDWHDTGFLNADDEDVVEDEDCMASAEQTNFLENSGWSSRSRAVAKYLKTLFDKEAEHGRKVLPMDNLLVGKTRKEASRMFFEALVLKTRDYIHVEQEAPFDAIKIKPRVMLMKSDL